MASRVTRAKPTESPLHCPICPASLLTTLRLVAQVEIMAPIIESKTFESLVLPWLAEAYFG